MLIRCTRAFRDLKSEGRPLRAVGEVWEADEERLAELNRAGYGKLAEPAPAPAEPEDLSKMTKAQLLAVAEVRGVEVENSFTKARIIEALEG